MFRKIYIILGTKAQLIKMAPLMTELQDQGVNYSFVFTGQHKETIDELRANFGVKKPDKILYSGRDITGVVQMFLWMWKILFKVIFNRREIFPNYSKNDVILVHGDTFSTLLGALIGKLMGMKVGHVESGLRSFNFFHPFPEELTRICTFFMTDYYYCPGEMAVSNLKKFKGEKINLGANTLYDSLQLVVKNFDKSDVDIPKKRYALCSVHRFENIFKQDRLINLLNVIERVAEEVPVLFVMHLPTKRQLEKFGLYQRLVNMRGVELRPRYDYLDFIKLLSSAEFLMTDGGSNQEECFYLGKPCLLLRMATERDEGLGQNVLLSKYNDDLIGDFIVNYQKYAFDSSELKISPSKKIVDHLIAL